MEPWDVPGGGLRGGRLGCLLSTGHVGEETGRQGPLAQGPRLPPSPGGRGVGCAPRFLQEASQRRQLRASPSAERRAAVLPCPRCYPARPAAEQGKGVRSDGGARGLPRVSVFHKAGTARRGRRNGCRVRGRDRQQSLRQSPGRRRWLGLEGGVLGCPVQHRGPPQAPGHRWETEAQRGVGQTPTSHALRKTAVSQTLPETQKKTRGERPQEPGRLHTSPGAHPARRTRTSQVLLWA